jgi:hypothetical protein
MSVIDTLTQTLEEINLQVLKENESSRGRAAAKNCGEWTASVVHNSCTG